MDRDCLICDAHVLSWNPPGPSTKRCLCSIDDDADVHERPAVMYYANWWPLSLQLLSLLAVEAYSIENYVSAITTNTMKIVFKLIDRKYFV